MKLSFFQIEATIQMKLSGLLVQVKQRNKRAERVMHFVDDCIVVCEKLYTYSQLLQM